MIIKTVIDTNILVSGLGNPSGAPDCKASTSGPHSDDLKAINIGEAAHIRGAAPGSARHDPNMTSTERSSIINAIWLCSKCSKLIDSDEKKYTVEVLYKWKRDHENEMELKLNETGWQRKIKEFNLRQFENESPVAHQIALDQPAYWQYLLTVELLRSKLNVIKKEFDNLKRGLLYKPSVILDEHQSVVWFQQRLHDLEALIMLLLVASSEELIASIGNSDQLIAEMDRIPKEISTIFSVPNPPDGEYVIKLVFTPPHNMDEVSKEVGKFASLYT